MEKQFKEFLISEGCKEFTPRGNKSTVYDYVMRIRKVREWERLSWGEFIGQISEIVKKYDIGGEKEDVGKKSHNAYICALRTFKRFYNTRDKCFK